eukprot:NODE_12250_length_518_cov_40.131646_g11961_i0.p1 GENE.NODE_12250_length_518_cov_40.131646_g11961_i0~~NODE_12250_length_518_cov_40.131646_g11961_i0.p1  ORF type:complete len:104 (-),score=11.23 NODE_12250_length_518_cov_40.131646_g11961_i0:121-432(-)
MPIPKLDGYFTGTGDLFSALVLGWSTHEPSFRLACEKAVAALQAVLFNTTQHYREVGGESKEKSQKIAARELRLIQSKNDIENPVVKIPSTLLGEPIRVGSPP